MKRLIIHINRALDSGWYWAAAIIWAVCLVLSFGALILL